MAGTYDAHTFAAATDLHAREDPSRSPEDLSSMNRNSRCWCGNDALESFSADYLRCPVCETLVLARMPEPAALLVTDDETDLYGRKYYESYLTEQFGFPSLAARTRSDLQERCVHWLKALLKYKLPPTRVLELGSAHGAFVALMRWAGFDATGLELSPWLVEFARDMFAIPTLTGPIEQQTISPQSLDAIVLMDVLEHLGDPESTMRICRDLLKQDGIVVIQTPRYREGKSYEQMRTKDDPFLMQLKPDQHLFLFSNRSVRELLRRLGMTDVRFEPAIFSSYDQFLVASPSPLAITIDDEVLAKLSSSPASRLVQAILDVDARLQQVTNRYTAAEKDRDARLLVIEDQGRRFGEVEADRNRLVTQYTDLQAHFDRSEEDRAARLNVIEEQAQRLGEVEAERNRLLAQYTDLRAHFDRSEEDRAARLSVIEEQGRRLGEVEAERNQLLAQYADLRAHFEQQARRLADLERETNTLSKSRVYHLMRFLGFWK